MNISQVVIQCFKSIGLQVKIVSKVIIQMKNNKIRNMNKK